jgi:Ras-related protein Rab-7A
MTAPAAASSSDAAASGKRQMIKMVVLGDTAVGKTNLLNCFVHRKFDSRYKSTIGSDFVSKIMTIDGTSVNLQLWDTAGQERFQSLGTAYLRGSEACILVFDVTSQESFEHLSSWLEEFVGQCGKKPIVLLANKCDNDLDPSKRAITTATAKRWCQVNGDVMLFETSARDSINVDTAFEYIAQQALRERKNQAEDMTLPDPMRVKRVGAQPAQPPPKSCPC